LTELLEREAEAPVQYEILLALSEIPAARALPLFRERLHHPDPLISALAIETLGPDLDEAILPKLFRIVEANEDLDRYHECHLQTAKAIEALGRCAKPEVIAFLAGKIHHRNPTARQLVHEVLIGMGAQAVAALAPAFAGADVDMQIMAANVLGEIGDRRGGEVMLAALDRGAVGDANVRFAIYEAFGKIRFMKGLICLLDALDEPDDMCRMAVVGGLENQANGAVVEKLRERLRGGGEAAGQLARTIGAARALNLFAALYPEEGVGGQLVEAVSGSGDAEQAGAFLGVLEGMAARAGDVEKLRAVAGRAGGLRILAVDDSKSMILFYRSVAAGAGLEVITAGNGKEALGQLERGERVDLVVSDMNMPEMNGIDLVRQIRSRPEWRGLRVIMVTTESEASQIELAKRVGVDRFLRKPFQPEALLREIAALTGRRE
jgi:CheY-like chemotaxis protein